MFVLNLLSIVVIASRRLWNQKALTASIALGLIIAVGLVTSIPLYADAVNYRLLRQELAQGQGRPPFAFMFRYIGAWHGNVEWKDYLPVNTYLSERASPAIGLPLETAVRHVKSDNLRLFPAAEALYADKRQPLAWVNLGFISGLAEHIEVIEGHFPQPATEPLEVMVSQAKADELGLQVGEDYVLFGQAGPRILQLPVRIAGVWRPRDAKEIFWFYPAESFDEVLFVPEESFGEQVAPLLKGEVSLAVWYLIFDGRNVHTGDVPRLLARIATARATAASLLANTSLDVSPVEAMQKYRRTFFDLVILLYAFSIPILGLILYFIVLISGLVVQRQRNEIATLRSRGASSAQILGIYLLEGALIGLAALAIGPILGRGLAGMMGRARTFLLFSGRDSLPVSISFSSLRFALMAIALALLASLIPALSASQHTIVSYKREVARSLRKSFWQRYFLDLALLAPALYGYYMLRRRGTISFLGRGTAGGPFQNPLLFLVPTLFIFSLALVFIRLFPRLMEALARLSGYLPATAPFLALRHLARSPAHYTAPLLLLVLTLSLASFTSSMARTFDGHLSDQVYYRVGADLNLAEMGERETERPGDKEIGGEGEWLFLPVGEHLRVPGVRAATRVGDYTAIARLGEQTERGRFLGVDRVDFPKVAFFRHDFAPQSLGALMNALALRDDALLASRRFLSSHGLKVGDRLLLTVDILGERREMEFTVAGVLDLFPTLYPEDGPFFVGNLDYVFEQTGGLFPYDVWLAVEEDADPEAVIQGVRRELGVPVISAGDARGLIAKEEAQPERQGFFGLLSVGFVASAVLTVAGFLLYSVISFHRRFVELGVLRAIGLSLGQMAGFLAWEQTMLIAAGLAIGTGLGVWASYLFVPFMQVGVQTPPFIVRIAWGDISKVCLIFAGMLVVAIVSVLVLLARMKVYEAVKIEAE